MNETKSELEREREERGRRKYRGEKNEMEMVRERYNTKSDYERDRECVTYSERNFLRESIEAAQLLRIGEPMNSSVKRMG